MIVANAISELVDGSGKPLVFNTHEIMSSEVGKYMSLTKAQFNVGSIDDLKTHLVSAGVQVSISETRSSAVIAPLEPVAIKEISRANQKEVISEQNIASDNELVPHEKPDSDREDEEEDPTLVDRTKHTPPV